MSERIAEVEAAADVPGRTGLDVLLRAAQDRSSSVRTAAINALAWRKGKASLEAILVGLEDRDALARLASVEALGIRRHVASRSRLKRILTTDPDSLVRAYAADALGQIGGARTALMSALESERSDDVRLRVLVALGRSGRGGFLFEAFGFCWSEDYRLRCAALNLLGEIVKGDDRELFLLVAQRMSQLDASYAVRSTADRIVRELVER